MMPTILNLLARHHPTTDVAINGLRLVPAKGWVVEYEHWYGDQIHHTSIAFVKFTDQKGGAQVEWTHIIK